MLFFKLLDLLSKRDSEVMSLAEELRASRKATGEDAFSFGELAVLNVTGGELLAQGNGIEAGSLVITVGESVSAFEFGKSFIQAALSQEDVTEVFNSGDEARVVRGESVGAIKSVANENLPGTNSNNYVRYLLDSVGYRGDLSTLSGSAPGLNESIRNNGQRNDSIDHYGQWEDTAYRLREYVNDARG
ncbi:MAG: hypothetical protein IPK73_04470 [Candidatus Obscuribacter sp.]|nr:hypothetical protein [Candidatus Obscuribacter sp.]